jgi:hypothetical protein
MVGQTVLEKVVQMEIEKVGQMVSMKAVMKVV